MSKTAKALLSWLYSFFMGFVFMIVLNDNVWNQIVINTKQKSESF
jgi:hypothetical protein